MVPARTDFRPDLEGLRGVAILLVVLFHAGVPALAGGFVGVDVFFVLSGFFITGMLADERMRDGTVDLLEFYSRRGLPSSPRSDRPPRNARRRRQGPGAQWYPSARAASNGRRGRHW